MADVSEHYKTWFIQDFSCGIFKCGDTLASLKSAVKQF